MALTLTALNQPSTYDYSQRRQILQGTGVFSGSYVAGGEPVNWNGIKDVSGQNVLLNSLSSSPLWVEAHSSNPASSSPLWYILQYNYATGKIQVIVSGAAAGDGFEELAAGAYPAALTGAVIAWKAEFSAE